VKLFRRKTDREKRDEAIYKAHDHLHLAIEELRRAHWYAAEMNDPGVAPALWESGEARIRPPCHTPKVAVRFKESAW
jgi:hypothetical protein